MRLRRPPRPGRGGGGVQPRAVVNTLWSAARHVVRAVKRLVLGRDDGAQRLSRTVARMEREAMGLGG